MKKVWLITGSSRGLGQELVKAVLESGAFVVATSRNTSEIDNLSKKYPNQVLILPLVVTVKEQIDNVIQKTIARFGRIDVLVNNAGFRIIGATEVLTNEQVRSQLEINLYGAIEVTRRVIPYMRKQRGGRILNISSAGGRIGSNPGFAVYQAAKFGLSGFTESLASELTPLGILVTSVEPGGMATDWSRFPLAADVEGYENTVGAVKTMVQATSSSDAIYGSDPVKIAQLLIKVTEATTPPIHLLVGKDAYEMVESGEAKRQKEMMLWKKEGENVGF